MVTAIFLIGILKLQEDFLFATMYIEFLHLDSSTLR